MESSFAEIYEILRQETKTLKRVNKKKKPKDSEAQVHNGNAENSASCSDCTNTDLLPKQKKKCHLDKSREECGTQNKKPKKHNSLQEVINVISVTPNSMYSVNSSETENAIHKKKKKRRNSEPSTFEQSKEWTEFQMYAIKQEPSESTPIKSNNEDIPRKEKRKHNSEEIPKKRRTKRDSEASISEEISVKKSKSHIFNEETQEKTMDKSILICSSKEEIQSPIKKKKKRHKSDTLSFEESCSDHKIEKHKGCRNEDEKELHENYQNLILSDLNEEIQPTLNKKKKKKRHKSETLNFEEDSKDKQETNSTEDLVELQENARIQKAANSVPSDSIEGNQSGLKKKKKKLNKYETSSYEECNNDNESYSIGHGKKLHVNTISLNSMLSNSSKEESSKGNKKHMIKDGIEFRLSTPNQTFPVSNLDVSREEDIALNFKKKKKKRHRSETLIFEESNKGSKYLTNEKLMGLQAMKQVDPILISSSKDEILEPEKKKKKKHKNKAPIFENSNNDGKELSSEKRKGSPTISIKEETCDPILTKPMKNCNNKQMIKDGIEFQLSTTNWMLYSNLDVSREEDVPTSSKKKKKKHHKSKTLMFEESNEDGKYLATEELLELQENAMKHDEVDSNLITSSKDEILGPEKKQKKKHKNKTREGLLAIPIQEELSSQILAESKNIIQPLLKRKKKKRRNTESSLPEEIIRDIEKPETLIDEQNLQVSGEEIQPPSKKKRKKHKNSEIAIPEDVIKSKKKHEKKAKSVQSIELLDIKMKEETLPNAKTKKSLLKNIETSIELPTEKFEETKESSHKKTEYMHPIESPTTRKLTTKIEAKQLENEKTNKPRKVKKRHKSLGTEEVVGDEKMFKTAKSDTKHQNKASTSQNKDTNHNDSPNHSPFNNMKNEDTLENILITVEPTKTTGISTVKKESLNEDVETLDTAPAKKKKRKSITRGLNGNLKPTQNSDVSKEEFDGEDDLLDNLIESRVAAMTDNHSKKKPSIRNNDCGANKRERSTEYYGDENELEDYQNQMLQSLDFVVPFEPPILHQFSNCLNGKPRGTQLQVLQDMKLVVQKGKFSKKEDDIIRRNWKDFCKTHYLPDNPAPFVNLVFRSNAGRSCSLSKDSSRKFLQFLARDLNTRLLATVYRRFQMIYRTDQLGNYSIDEDEKILNFMKTHADDRTPFSTLGRLLNRDKLSVEKRHTVLVKMEEMKKRSEDMVEEPTAQNIVKWLVKVTKCRKVIELRDREITNAEWNEVGKKVGLWGERLQKRWKTRIYVRLFSTVRDVMEIKKKFVDLLCKDGADDFRTIDYNSFAKKYFENVTGSYLYNLLRETKRHLPSECHYDLPKCLKHLKEVYFPSACRTSFIETICVSDYEEKDVNVIGELVSTTDEEGSVLDVP